MKIAVNTRLLLHNKLEGIGRFTWESLKRICLSHPEHEFHLFFDRSYHPSFIISDNMIPHVLAPQARHPILFNIWFNWSVSKKLKQLNPDVFLSPDGYLSLKTEVKQLAVIHDLNFEHRPQDLPKKFLRYYKSKFPLFANKATRIATVSAYSKQDIANCYKKDLGKIDVVFNGISGAFVPATEPVKESNYFLYVGSIHPRKNLACLLEAFNKLEQPAVKLKIVGAKMFGENKEAASMSKNIEFLGRVSDSELGSLYQNAIALVFPSHFEGFGIPLIEAMACGCPVISSNSTCLPEIGGDACLYFDPKKPDQLASQMALVRKPQIREELIREGFKQQSQFSWDRTASLLWESICLTAKA